MFTTVVHALFGLWVQAAPSPLGPYASVLREVGSLAPGRQVVLSTSRSRPECSPHCEDSLQVDSHSADVTNSLKERGLILATCTPRPESIDCGSGREVWAADRMVVTLGPLEQKDMGQVEVSAMVHWRFEYGGRARSSLRGYRYRLVCDGGGQWKVVSAVLAWTA